MKKLLFVFGAYLIMPLSVQAITFFDVLDNHKNQIAIEELKKAGIVNGYDTGRFKPEAPVNRAEFTKIVINAVYPSKVESCNLSVNSFPDVESAAWFAPYICVAKAEGLIQGYPDKTFKPDNNINFVEAAKIISPLFSNIEDTNSNIWFEPFVKALIAKSAVPLDIESFEQELTRGQMAEIIYRLKWNIQNRQSKTYKNLSNNVSAKEDLEAGLRKINENLTNLSEDLTSDDSEIRKLSIEKVLKNPNEHSPPVLYALSQGLTLEGREDDAYYWYSVAHLRTRYDALKTKRYIGLSDIFSLELERSPVIEIEAVPPEILKRAIDFVVRNGEDYDPLWIAAYGDEPLPSGLADSAMLLSESEWSGIKSKLISRYRAFLIKDVSRQGFTKEEWANLPLKNFNYLDANVYKIGENDDYSIEVAEVYNAAMVNIIYGIRQSLVDRVEVDISGVQGDRHSVYELDRGELSKVVKETTYYDHPKWHDAFSETGMTKTTLEIVFEEDGVDVQVLKKDGLVIDCDASKICLQESSKILNDIRVYELLWSERE